MDLDNDLMDKWLAVHMGADAAFCRELIEEIQTLRNEVAPTNDKVEELTEKLEELRARIREQADALASELDEQEEAEKERRATAEHRLSELRGLYAESL